MTGALVRCDDRRALDAALAGVRAEGGEVAFVPTMGALHVGHRVLVERAAAIASNVVVSIFVNPTQFDVAADLASYPRTLDADLALLSEVADASGVRLFVYVPTVADVYPDGAVSSIRIPEVTEHLCGASRPGHFDGVATVVDALLRAARPTVLIMGRKDHQQLAVVRRLIAMQGHRVRVDAAPTVRDVDGVAVSSRNRLLDGDARGIARRIPHALAEAVALVRSAREAGTSYRPAAVRAVAMDAIAGEGLRVDYLATVDPERIVPVDEPRAADQPVLLAVAAHVTSGPGSVRLIDNVLLGDLEDEQRLLDALAGPGDPVPAPLEG
jgi:pantoate--beta-alanine ligase